MADAKWFYYCHCCRHHYRNPHVCSEHCDDEFDESGLRMRAEREAPAALPGEGPRAGHQGAEAGGAVAHRRSGLERFGQTALPRGRCRHFRVPRSLGDLRAKGYQNLPQRFLKLRNVLRRALLRGAHEKFVGALGPEVA